MQMLKLLGRLLLFFYHVSIVGYMTYTIGDYISSKEAELYAIILIIGVLAALVFSVGAHLVNLFYYVKNFKK